MFAKLGMCINIMEILFGIANGQISSIFYIICPPHNSSGIVSFHIFYLKQP